MLDLITLSLLKILSVWSHFCVHVFKDATLLFIGHLILLLLGFILIEFSHIYVPVCHFWKKGIAAPKIHIVLLTSTSSRCYFDILLHKVVKISSKSAIV